jgi:hypothetical protein
VKVPEEVAQLNNTFGLSDAERLMNEVNETVTTKDWISRVPCAELQQEDFHEETARDEGAEGDSELRATEGQECDDGSD